MLRLAVIATILITGGAAVSGFAVSDEEWESFKAKYKRTYKGAADEAARRALFTISKARVAKLNELNGQPAFGINEWSDRYDYEKPQKGYNKPGDFLPTERVINYGGSNGSRRLSPASIDWRNTPVVTPIKNQGQCGSCWAFSATEAIESQWILRGGNPNIALSPQQIASCAPSCRGCNGGFTEGAYEYLKSANGLANSFDIPYAQSLTQSEGTLGCPTSKVQQLKRAPKGAFATVSGYHYAVSPCISGSCDHQDLKALRAALETTPVSVCVNAGAWYDYTGGVMTAQACGSMGADSQDHCVMVVGFNAAAPTPYWIVRNSWASAWGERGYIYLEMGKNTCGVANDATVPEVQVSRRLAEGFSEEAARIAAQRETWYQQATGNAAKGFVV